MSALAQAARGKALKEASGELVKSVGGLEAAADYRDKGKSTFGRYTLASDDEHFMPLRDAVELERIAPEPVITKMMCKLAGGVFLPLPDATPDCSEISLRVLELAKELGDVSAQVRIALANDGQVDAVEAASIERELEQLVDSSVQTLALVRAIQGKPAAKPRTLPKKER